MSCGVKGGHTDHGHGDILNVESHRRNEEELMDIEHQECILQALEGHYLK